MSVFHAEFSSSFPDNVIITTDLDSSTELLLAVLEILQIADDHPDRLTEATSRATLLALARRLSLLLADYLNSKAIEINTKGGTA